MIRSINTRYVPVSELRAFDPELRSFTNINKLEDLKRINGQHTPCTDTDNSR
jgi:molybdopterin-guanine dinucleotide biosynthesis protein A